MKKNCIVIIASVLILCSIITFGEIFTVKEVEVSFVDEKTSVGEKEILILADIYQYGNIFAVDEKDVANRIENGFDDNSVEVINIVRSFPNKVTIYARERFSMFYMKKFANEEQLVVTDLEFQRSTLIGIGENVESYVGIVGAEVNTNFNTPELLDVYEMGQALTEIGMTEESIRSFLHTIEFVGNAMVINLDLGGKITLDREDDIKSQTQEKLANYLKLSYGDRKDCDI